MADRPLPPGFVEVPGVEDLRCAIALLDTHAVGGRFGPKEEAYALVADWLQREVDRRVVITAAQVMTVGDALRALVKAGRIRSPWLSGMRLQTPREDGSLRSARLGDAFTEPADGRVWSPDLTDPATVGCLLALLREAVGDPWAHTVQDHLDTGDGWRVMVSRGWPPGWTRHRTEGEALAAALIALAGAL